MNRLLVVSVVMLFALGCGPEAGKVEGKWSGALTTYVNCPSASGSTAVAGTTSPATWIIREHAQGISIITDGPCGELTAVHGSSGLYASPKSCATDVSNGYRTSRSFVSAELSLGEEVLRIRQFIVETKTGLVGGGSDQACTETSEGALGLEP